MLALRSASPIREGEVTEDKIMKSKVDADRRSIRLATNVSPAEMTEIKSKSLKYGIDTISDYLRIMALAGDAPPTVSVPEANVQLSRNLSSLHSNLNQVLIRIHSTRSSQDELLEAVDLVSRIGRSLTSFRRLLSGEISRDEAILIANNFLSPEDLAYLYQKKTKNADSP